VRIKEGARKKGERKEGVVLWRGGREGEKGKGRCAPIEVYKSRRIVKVRASNRVTD